MKPTIPEVMPIVNALYAKHSAGCCWHVVLDDGNVSEFFVKTTANGVLAIPCSIEECNLLAKLLPLMSRTQITKLYKEHQ